MSESFLLIVCFIAGALLAGVATWWLLRVRVNEALAAAEVVQHPLSVYDALLEVRP